MPIIFHIDMNSYFATVEQQANPHLRGKPIGVCEHLGGIIIAPSIEAKKLGIKTAMPVWEARKIYPGIILLKVDPPKVRSVTERFLKIFSEFTDVVERYSIDEAFLDITNLIPCSERLKFSLSRRGPASFSRRRGEEGRERSNRIKRSFAVTQDDKKGDKDDSFIWDQALLYALEIKQRIRREIGEWLTCSIGIASNKLIAKIASDIDKPDGLTLVRPQDIPGLYSRIDLTDIPGIGTRMARRLAVHNIFSPLDLPQYPESRLRAEFGLVGHYLARLGRFEDTGGFVVPDEERIKSMGHSYTMSRATGDEKEIKKLLFKLSEKIALRLRRKNMWGSVVSFYAGSSQGGFGKTHRIHDFINDGRLIFDQAWKLFESAHIFPPQAWGGVRGEVEPRPVKMLGVTVSGLAENLADEPLFEKYKKPQWALQAMDKVNNKHGDFTLRRGVLLSAKNLAQDTVGFGRLAP